MTIRTRLTLLFFFLVIFVVSFITVSIYFFSADYREDDFYRRLRNRAVHTTLVLMEYEEINAELLKKMEKENPASLPMQFVKIYNRSNSEIFSLDEESVLHVDNAFLDMVREKEEYRFSQGNFEILGFLFKAANEELVVIAGATDLHGRNALDNLRSIIMVIFLFSIVVVSILGWIYSGRVLKPISRIVREVDNITEANLNKRLDEGNRTDELSKLAQTFNRMLSRLEGSFHAQKNFIANASHELKTPFTVMAGEIEVTLLQPREKEYYIRILHSVLQGIRRFNKLSTQLLLLAQTSSDTPDKRFASFRIDDMLWEAKTELERLHPDYVIDIVFDLNIHYDLLMINGDEQLVKVLIMNLMDNGCKYSDNSTVLVTLSANESRFVTIQFVNSGEGILPNELEHIFNPFYRGKSRRKVKGFGVGLSLCDKIVKLHEGRITAESIPQEITRFTIELPIEHPTPRLG